MLYSSRIAQGAGNRLFFDKGLQNDTKDDKSWQKSTS